MAGLLFMLMVYLPLSLHRVYSQRKRWTIVKTLLLFPIYIQLVGVVFSGTVLVVLEAMS